VPIVVPTDVSSIALQGLEQASAQLDAAATQIASAGTDGSPVDTVSLSEEMVALMSAKTAFAANNLRIEDRRSDSTESPERNGLGLCCDADCRVPHFCPVLPEVGILAFDDQFPFRESRPAELEPCPASAGGAIENSPALLVPGEPQQRHPSRRDG
jgi:hypothetical protein